MADEDVAIAVLMTRLWCDTACADGEAALPATTAGLETVDA
jgi:hypothetical protein